MIQFLNNTFTIIKILMKKSPFFIFTRVVTMIKPFVELRPIKHGSTKYLVPTPLNETRKLFLTFSYCYLMLEHD